jgi:hypothetical protein
LSLATQPARHFFRKPVPRDIRGLACLLRCNTCVTKGDTKAAIGTVYSDAMQLKISRIRSIVAQLTDGACAASVFWVRLVACSRLCDVHLPALPRNGRARAPARHPQKTDTADTHTLATNGIATPTKTNGPLNIP